MRFVQPIVARMSSLLTFVLIACPGGPPAAPMNDGPLLRACADGSVQACAKVAALMHMLGYQQAEVEYLEAACNADGWLACMDAGKILMSTGKTAEETDRGRRLYARGVELSQNHHYHGDTERMLFHEDKAPSGGH